MTEELFAVRFARSAKRQTVYGREHFACPLIGKSALLLCDFRYGGNQCVRKSMARKSAVMTQVPILISRILPVNA